MSVSLPKARLPIEAAQEMIILSGSANIHERPPKKFNCPATIQKKWDLLKMSFVIFKEDWKPEELPKSKQYFYPH